jgi:hypothetical protein
VELFESISRSPLVSDYQCESAKGKHSYISITFSTNDTAGLWSHIRGVVKASPFAAAIVASTIVVCEGKDGWNDYLLLHHYDFAEPLDGLLGENIERS